MDYFGLDEDERVIAETAAAFADKRLAPHALDWDQSHHFPTDALREAAELGMAAIYCREDVGGSGLRRIDAVLSEFKSRTSGSALLEKPGGSWSQPLALRSEVRPLRRLSSSRAHPAPDSSAAASWAATHILVAVLSPLARRVRSINQRR